MSETEKELSKVDWPATRYGVLSGIIAGAITNPIVGGAVGGLLSVVGPTIESRVLNFWRRTDNDFERLAHERSEVEFEKVLSSEAFATAVWQIAQYVPRNHEQENLDALRNALLNSALPESPDETSQKMFITWAGELTAWHIQILKVFDLDAAQIPNIPVHKPDWPMNLNSTKLMQLIEARYPEMRKGYDLCIQIINDLYSRGLISNWRFSRDGFAEIRDPLVLSSTGTLFLNFISSPFDKDAPKMRK